MVLLSIERIVKRYLDGGVPRTVLDGVSLELEAGESVALWGPSGSGKSTLLNIVAGVQTLDEGRIVLAESNREATTYGRERPAATARLRRERLGYIFQFFNLVPTLTVAENVELSLRLARRTSLREAALARAERLGLGHRLHAFPEQLSGGEQQRAAIARALAPEPALLLADEPTGNLDAGNAARVVDALWEMVADLDCALLLATHDEAVAGRADRRLELG